jgi:putative flippase GtrA
VSARDLLRRLILTRRDRDRPPGHAVAIPRNVIASLIATSFEAIFIPILVELVGLHYMIAVMGCMLVATTISFFLNKYWVFEARSGRAPLQYVKQIVVAGGSFVGNTGLIWSLTEYVGLHYYLSFIGSNVLVFFCWNYPVSRWFVFSDGHGGTRGNETPPAGISKYSRPARPSR